QTYAAVADELTDLIGTAQQRLAGTGDQLIEFNATPHTRASVPALGAGTPVADANPVTAHGFVLDNGIVRVVLDRQGLLESVYDKVADREVMAPGARGNQLALHPDLTNPWDAWDVDSFYRNTVTDIVDVDELALVDEGPDHATILVRRSFGSSTVRQLLTLRAGERQLEIDTEIDWHETEKFLKLTFPLDLHTDRFAAETQFGHIYRNAHANTSWDAAKFEVCAHRWIRLAEPDYGVALVNDATY